MKNTLLIFLLFTIISKSSVSQQLVPQLNKNGSYSLVKFGTNSKIDDNQYEEIEPLGDNFFKIKLNGLWGVRNQSVTNLIPTDYDVIQKKSEGYIISKKLNQQEYPKSDEKFITHIYDTLGNKVYDIKTYNITDFKNGISNLINLDREVTYSLLTIDNDYPNLNLIDLDYSTTNEFIKSIISVNSKKYFFKKKKYKNSIVLEYDLEGGLKTPEISETNYVFDEIIDINGDIILKYPEIDGLVSDGIFSVTKNTTTYGCVNINNDTIIPFKYNNISEFKNEMSIVDKDVLDTVKNTYSSKYGIINLKGDIIIPFTNSILSLNNFSDGFSYKVSDRDGFSGLFFNILGKTVFKVPINRDIIHKKFENKLIGFKENIGTIRDEKIKVGFYDNNFNIKIFPKYDFADMFNNGFSKVSLNNKFGLINTSGTQVLQLKYDKIFYRHFNHENYINGDYISYGFNNSTSEDLDYNDLIFHENIVRVEIDNRIFYVDINGFEYIEK